MQVKLWRYALVYVLTAIGVAVLTGLLSTFTGYGGSGGVSTVLPPMIAAMVEGQRWAQGLEGPMPEKRVLWQGAGICTGVAALVNVVFFAILWLIPDMGELFQTLGLGLIAVMFVVLMVVVFLINRVGLGMGVRNAERMRS